MFSWNIVEVENSINRVAPWAALLQYDDAA